METTPNDAAFPEGKDDVPGLTKREWFAGMAMMGLLANEDNNNSIDDFGRWSVEYADDLIAALNKGAKT